MAAFGWVCGAGDLAHCFLCAGGCSTTELHISLSYASLPCRKKSLNYFKLLEATVLLSASLRILISAIVVHCSTPSESKPWKLWLELDHDAS